MKITFLPQSNLGRWSIGLITAFFIFLSIFFMFVNSGERGGDTYFSNLKLTIPFTIAWLCAISSFFTGAATLTRKEYSVLVFLSTLLGFLILLWILGEFLFPH